jgi:hypothetical protein
MGGATFRVVSEKLRNEILHTAGLFENVCCAWFIISNGKVREAKPRNFPFRPAAMQDLSHSFEMTDDAHTGVHT